MKNIEILTQRLLPLTTQINHHSLYEKIHTTRDLEIFMENHVFTVWDFMCLLKELHGKIVSVSSPWVPPKDALSTNLINSILVEEEGDMDEQGNYTSHFDLYLRAMEEVGADTSTIEKLLFLLRKKKSVKSALVQLPIQAATKKFVLTTFSFFHGEPHEVAAAFVYGREGITSSMFLPLMEQLKRNLKHHSLDILYYYFQRHADLDDGSHFPKALQMLDNLVGGDEQKLKAAEKAAIKALTARLDFLTGIQHALPSSNNALPSIKIVA